MPFSILQPHPVGVENPATVRASAALPAAGAWDATPLVIPVAGFWWVRLYFTYERAEEAAAGTLDYYYDVSPYSADADATNEAWFHGTLYVPGTLTPCEIVHSTVQQEFITYCSTSGNAETFISPPVHLAGCIERFRLFCREAGMDEGQLVAPGTVEVLGGFYIEG